MSLISFKYINCSKSSVKSSAPPSNFNTLGYLEGLLQMFIMNPVVKVTPAVTVTRRPADTQEDPLLRLWGWTWEVSRAATQKRKV